MPIALAIGGVAVLASAGLHGVALWPATEAEALAMPGVGEQVPRESLATGMCPNGVPERPINDYDTLPIVDCDDEHLEELFASQAPPAVVSWDAGVIRDFEEALCDGAFIERTAQTEQESLLSITYYFASEADW